MRVSLAAICILMVALWGCGTEPSEPGDESNAKKSNETPSAKPANAVLPEIRYYVLSKG